MAGTIEHVFDEAGGHERALVAVPSAAQVAGVLHVEAGRVADVVATIAALRSLTRPPAQDVVRPAVQRAVDLPVGPPLTAAADVLTGMLDALSAAEMRQAVVAWHRTRSHAAAGELTVAAALDAALRAPDPQQCGDRGALVRSRAAAGELAVALGVAHRTAGRLVGLSREAQDLPAAVDAMAEGVLSTGVLEVLVATVRGLSVPHRRELEARAVSLAARGRTRAQIKHEIEHLAARRDPAWAVRHAEAGRSARDVGLRPSPVPGCVRLVADLPLVHGHAAWHGLDAAARSARAAAVRPDGTPEDRDPGQLRADALVGAVTGLTAQRLQELVAEAVSRALSSAGTTSSAVAPPGALVPTTEDLARLVELQVVSAVPGPPPEPPSDLAPDACPPDACPPGASPPAGGPVSGAGDGRSPVPVPVPADLVRRSRVRVAVAAGTLTGRHDHPAHLPAGGPVDVGTVRDLARSCGYRWLLVDDRTGHLLHRDAARRPPPAPGQDWAGPCAPAPPPLPRVTTATIRSPGYRPGALLRAHVESRDATCTGPACHHGVHGTDLDHTTNFGEPSAAGGTGATTAANLGVTCRAVHLLKTRGGWRVTQPSSGTFVWTTRLGFTTRREAVPVLPGWEELVGDGEVLGTTPGLPRSRTRGRSREERDVGGGPRADTATTAPAMGGTPRSP